MYERLMMSEEECRKKIKELLQIPKEDLLTKYMFQEQEIERLNNIINEAAKKSIRLQEKYGYILDDLTYLLMQNKNLQRRIGSDKNDKNSI